MINYQLKKQEEIIGTFETKKDVVDEMNNIIKNNSVLGFALRRRNAPANSANNLLICGMISYYFVKI